MKSLRKVIEVKKRERFDFELEHTNAISKLYLLENNEKIGTGGQRYRLPIRH